MDSVSNATFEQSKGKDNKKQKYDEGTIRQDESSQEPPIQSIQLKTLAANSKLQKIQKRPGAKRFKWTEKNTQIFIRIYTRYSGDLDLVLNYFNDYVKDPPNRTQLKNKMKKELKSIILKKREPFTMGEKIEKKFVRIAKRIVSEKTKIAIAQWSNLSEISLNGIVETDEIDREIMQNLVMDGNQQIRIFNKLQQDAAQEQ